MTAIARQQFAGRLEVVREARRFVSRTLVNAGVPRGVIDDAVSCVSELAANAIEHTASGDPDHTFEVRTIVRKGQVGVEVADDGAPLPPVIRPDAEDNANAEDGRGMFIVNRLGVAYASADPDGSGRRVGVLLELPPDAPVAAVGAPAAEGVS